MLISMSMTRLPNQHAMATLRTWTVQQGTQELAQVVWDPRGPLDARTAAMQALWALLECLGAPVAAAG